MGVEDDARYYLARTTSPKASKSTAHGLVLIILVTLQRVAGWCEAMGDVLLEFILLAVR